ncbi:MAG: DUF4388 domain-containing protein [Prochloraceae cyanobacterium]|nr:DUF4388 domain-containing protein [Prochloraceae cyanobacterium]
MSIAGSLEAYSLPELFRLLDSGSKSGKLVIQIQSGSVASNAKGAYSIWFYKGRLVGLTTPEERQELIDSIQAKGWLSERVIEKLVPLCPDGRPLGTYFKSIGALTEEQLTELFQVDLDLILKLFEINSGRFIFEDLSNEDKTDVLTHMPCLEMTGISLKGTEVALIALRETNNWDRFSDQLPEESSGLQKLVAQPQYRLVSLELEIWKHANSITPLDTIAKAVKESQMTVQKAAFRLMMSGQVEEVPHANLRAGLVSLRPLPSTSASPISADTQNKQKQEEKKPKATVSLLQNVVGFLRKQF